jgi:hypothetical protein
MNGRICLWELKHHRKNSKVSNVCVANEPQPAANQTLRRHNNAIYDRIAIRNVAKQIESLYWEEGAPDISDEEQDEDSEIARKGDDLTTDEYVSYFSPPTCPLV